MTNDNLHDPRLYPRQVDSRHYFFVRNSGLPRSCFKPWRPTQDQCVFWAAIVLAAIAIILEATT